MLAEEFAVITKVTPPPPHRAEYLFVPVTTDIRFGEDKILKNSPFTQKSLIVGNTGFQVQMLLSQFKAKPLYNWFMHFDPDQNPNIDKELVKEDLNKENTHRRAGMFASGFLSFYRWWCSGDEVPGGNFPKQNTLRGLTNLRFFEFQRKIFGDEILRKLGGDDPVEKILCLDRIASHPEVLIALEELSRKWGQ